MSKWKEDRDLRNIVSTSRSLHGNQVKQACKKAKMKWRKIVAEEVSAVISDPDKVEDSKKGRKNAFKIVHGRLLKVTYKQEGETAVVITAMVKGEKQDENRI